MSCSKTILFVPPGGMWNAWTTGCLFSLGIRPQQFDEIIGGSSGVPSLAAWMAGQQEQARDVWVKRMTCFQVFHWLKLIFLAELFQRRGLYAANVDYLFDHCCQDLDFETVCQLRKLHAVVYDVLSAETEIIPVNSDNFYTVCKASAAIPGLARRVIIEGREKVDGGTAKALPVVELLDRMGENGRLVIILNHTRDYHHPVVKQWQAWKAFPGPQEAKAREGILDRCLEHRRSMSLLEELERQGRVCIISPIRNPGMNSLSRRPAPVARAWEDGFRLGASYSTEVQKFLAEIAYR